MATFRCSCVCALLALAACSTTKPPPAPPSKPLEQWQPPEPNPKDWDWVKVDTGEWFKGDIKAMRRDKFEFDSDKIDDVNFDWDDVKELRSPRKNTVVKTDKSIVVGTVFLKDDTVAMKTEDGETVRFPRGEVLSLLPGEDRESNYWQGKFSFGFTGRTGNVDQVEVQSKLFVRRASPLSRLDFNYIGNFGELEGVTNVDNQRIDARLDLFVSPRWYITAAAVQAYRDSFQNIALQVTPSVGAGYLAIDKPKLTWELGGGAGWRFTEFESGAPGDDTPVAIFTTKLDWDITSDIEFIFSYNISIGSPPNDNIQHLVATFEIDLFKDIDLDITFQWDRVGEPRPEADGTVPQKSDVRVSLGLTWDF